MGRSNRRGLGPTVTLGMQNVLDSDPSFVADSFEDGYDECLATIKGCFWYAQLKKRFGAAVLSCNDVLRRKGGNDFRHEFETRSFPRSLAAARCRFTFYVADPSAPFTNPHELASKSCD